MEESRGVLEYKIVLLGGGGVGKSALTNRLLTGNFVEDYDPTIEDTYRKDLLVDNEAAVLEVLDTAGQEEFKSMQDHWIRDGRGFLLCYSITNKQSFDEVIAIYDKMIRVKETQHIPLVLVGNKCDMDSNRKVQTAEGEALAAKWNNSPFFETSSKDGLNVEKCFHEVVRLIRKMPATEQKRDEKRAWWKNCVIL